MMNNVDHSPARDESPNFAAAEVLNKIFSKVWLRFKHLIQQKFADTIKSCIDEAACKYTLGFVRCTGLDYGDAPPKISDIKFNEEKTSENDIILDFDITYAGNGNISLSSLYNESYIRNIKVQVRVQVLLRLNDTILLDAVEVSLLKEPSIDFDLEGILNYVNFPCVSQMLRQMTKEKIATAIVELNKSLAKTQEKLSIAPPTPKGIMRIHVVQAKYLMKKGTSVFGKRKSNLHAVINDGVNKYRTKTIENTVNPRWDDWFELPVTSDNPPSLTISVGNCDDAEGDESLGRATIEVTRIIRKGKVDQWYPLEFVQHGMVHVLITWLKLSKEARDLPAARVETQELSVMSMSTACLILYVGSAKKLPCPRGSEQSDVYLEASVGSSTIRTTTMLRTCNPIWGQGFTLFVGDPETASLNIKIMDEKTGTVLGTTTHDLVGLLAKEDMSEMQQSYDVRNANRDSKLVFSMTLRILKYVEPEPISEDDEDELSIIELAKKINIREHTVIRSLSSSVPSTVMMQLASNSAVSSVADGPTGIPESATAETLTAEKGTTILPMTPEAIRAFLASVDPNSSQTSSLGKVELGRINLTLQYSVLQQKLTVIVHEISNLPYKEPENVPKLYVKVYVLPDPQKVTKRKTASIEGNLNPVYNEEFIYSILSGDLNMFILQISLCAQMNWYLSSMVLGQVYLNPSDMDITQETTNRYDLMPPVEL